MKRIAVDSSPPIFQLKPIDAIYMLDSDYDFEPLAVEPITDITEAVPFDQGYWYRVYFEQCDIPHDLASHDDCPHADIFMQRDGQFCIEYTFIPTASPAEVESLKSLVRTTGFQSSALQRWGSFKLFWGRPSGNGNYHIGTNMLVYYDDQKAFVSLRRVGVQADMTFAQVMEDYLFLRDVLNRMLQRLKRDQPTQRQMPEEPISAKSQETDNTQVKIDIDKAREEMESLLVADDDSSLEPLDTTESDAHILSFFKKKETP
jgi:hypothetical protein